MGWFLTNIVLPVCAPTIILLALRLLPLPAAVLARASVLAAVKDGQLCFVSMSFCAAGLFEADGSDWRTAALTFLLVLSSLLAAGGAMFQTSLRTPPGRHKFAHFRCLLASIVATMVSATVYTAVHYKV
jgi:hypothetical protein